MLSEKTDPQQGAVAFHEQLAVSWNNKYEKPSFVSRHAAFAAVLGDVSLQAKRWLDAGCGTGIFSRWLAKRGANVVAFDAAPAMLQHARELSADERSIQFSVAALPDFQVDGKFDGVLCSSVLEYVDSPVKALERFNQVLNAGGILICSVPNSSSLVRRGLKAMYRISSLFGRGRPAWLKFSKNEFTAAEITSQLTAADFHVVQITYFGLPFARMLHGRKTFEPLILIKSTKR